LEYSRLERQIQFLMEIDQLKQILRQTLLTDKSRRENDAEHSWHISTMAVILSEYANERIDLAKVLKILLVHDLVEIYAGDTFCYDPVAGLDKEEREKKAADRLFSLLPDDQRDEIRGLWEEFEARNTPEARFALAMDRLQPILHNYFTEGVQWQKHEVVVEQVMNRNKVIAQGSHKLWEYIEGIIKDSVRKGYLNSEPLRGNGV
jgi:putative hydrolase of HD superfamily